MVDSIFTKIIKGEISCHKIYEDDLTIAFMDIHPIQPGHVLVVTKTQVANFFELNQQDSEAFWETINKVAKRLKEIFPNKRRVGVMIEGLDVDHVHAKLFPIDSGNEYRSLPDESIDPDHSALAEMANKLKF